MTAGTVYGVVLNDADELQRMQPLLQAPPYRQPPQAPVVYIKPRNCLTWGGASVPLPAGVAAVSAAATLAVSFRRDVCAAQQADVAAAIGGVCLAADISVPHDSYYRPAISQRCRDGFLPLGRCVALPDDLSATELLSFVDGVERHRWSLTRLVRPVMRLIADLSGFMTLCAGDMLLVGLPGDAPTLRDGQALDIRARGLPNLSTRIAAESLS